MVSVCAQGWAQVVHENPGTAIPSRSQSVDDQMAALLENMLGNLGDISAAVNGDNFTAARSSYSKFYSSFTKYNDLMWQLNLSEADYRAIAEQMNFTNDQVSAIIDQAEAYRESARDYDRAVAGNDSVNASASAAQARESYANISSSYGGLRYNATILERILTDQGIDTARLDSSISTLDQLMVNYNQSYSNMSSNTKGTALTLSADDGNLSVGAVVEFHVILKDGNGTPLGGDKVMIYVGGDLVSIAMTGSGGESTIRYTIPVTISGDHVLAHAEYVSGATILSNYVDLYVRDLPAAISLGLDRYSATYGDTVNVTGILTAGGWPVPYKTVNISFNDFARVSARTDKNGSFTYAFPIGSATPAEMITVNASYHRKPGDLLLDASSPDRMLGVLALPTDMTLDDLDYLSPGGVAGFTGSLRVKSGIPVAGANVSVFIDGTEVGRGTTDANGSYRVSAVIPQDIPAGDHTVFAGFRPGPGKALMESSSYAVLVPFLDSGRKLEVGGVPLVAFPGDRLNVSGKLATGNGMPIPDKALGISVFGGENRTIVTGPAGEFNQSYVIMGDIPGGVSSVRIVDPASGSMLYEASVLLIPYEQSAVLSALAIVVVALILVAGGWFLYRSYVAPRAAKPPETGEAPAATPAEKPAVIPEVAAPAVFILEDEVASIRSSMAGPDMREATTAAYISMKKLLSSMGLKLDDSMTHNEVYRAAAAMFPERSEPFKYIVDLYERAIFASRLPAAEELEKAIGCLENAVRPSPPEITAPPEGAR